MLFFRMLQHLLPTGQAWRVVVEKTLRGFLMGVSAWAEQAKSFVDLVYADVWPQSTRSLAAWEAQFGLLPSSSDAVRRQQVAAAWQMTGGQSPRYLQDVVRAAGFDVYIHESFYYSGATRLWRDPLAHTSLPAFGTVRCGMPSARCGVSSARCNALLANEPGYIVNRDLSLNAPPRVPAGSAFRPFFVYWGGATFGDRASVPASRRSEFERVLLKICPAHCWIVTMVDYV